MKGHPDDCECGREHGEALVFGLTRKWGRRRRLHAVLTLIGVAVFLAIAILLTR